MNFLHQFFRFDPETEKDFKDFQFSRERLSLRFTCYVACVYCLVLGVRDYQMFENTQAVILLRGSMFLLLILMLLGTYLLPTDKRRWIGTQIGLFLFTAFSFAQDFYDVVPAFTLPNVLVLLSFVAAAGLGLSFNRSAASILIALTGYFLYIAFIVDKDELNSQIFNVLINSTVALVIGLLFERESRINFHQRNKLMIANQALDKANYTKNKILSMLSHDLNTPISNLASVLDLKGKSIITEEEFAQLSVKIKQNLESASGLLGNITRWSKTQLDGFVPVTTQLEMRALVTEIIQGFGSLPSSKQLTIHNQVDENVVCFADKEMIKAAIRNIISNSIKFTEAGKNIWVVGISVNETAVLYIRDEGRGMTDEQVSNLFTLNIKSTPGTQNEKGFGIGLQLTHDFIVLNKGTIKASSTLGSGTVFQIQLPGQA
jgi:signal transduction histidine kinase